VHPLLKSHTRAVLSKLAVATRFPSGLHDTACTQPSCASGGVIIAGSDPPMHASAPPIAIAAELGPGYPGAIALAAASLADFLRGFSAAASLAGLLAALGRDMERLGYRLPTPRDAAKRRGGASTAHGAGVGRGQRSGDRTIVLVEAHRNLTSLPKCAATWLPRGSVNNGAAAAPSRAADGLASVRRVSA
jgi:hypothetical protein